jgi:hypothetical protein
MLSAQAAKGAAQLQSETHRRGRPIPADPSDPARVLNWGIALGRGRGEGQPPLVRLVAAIARQAASYLTSLRVGNDNPVARVGDSLLYKKSNHREWRFEVRSRETGMDRARAEGSIGTVAPRNNTQSSAAIFNDLGEAGRIVVVGGAYSHHVNLLV